MNMRMQILLMSLLLCLTNALPAMEVACVQKDNIQVARAMALFDLGMMLIKTKDFKKAIDYLEEAASQQENLHVKIRALLKLGDMFCLRLGKDCKKAYAYFEQIEHLEKDNFFQVTEHHHYLRVKADVCYQLGRMFYFGLVVEKDYPKAYKYLEQAICLKENLDRIVWALAYWLLGEMFYEGLGTEKDYYKARESFEQAANHYKEVHVLNLALLGLPDLGLLAKSININYQKAYGNDDQLENMQVSKVGKALALLRFGMMYQFALGVKKDNQKAREYYGLVAQQEEDLAIRDRATELLKQASFSQGSMKVLKTH